MSCRLFFEKWGKWTFDFKKNMNFILICKIYIVYHKAFKTLFKKRGFFRIFYHRRKLSMTCLKYLASIEENNSCLKVPIENDYLSVEYT